MESRRKNLLLFLLAAGLFVGWWFLPVVKLEEAPPDFSAGLPDQKTAYRTDRPWEPLNIIDIHGHIGTYRGFDLSKETLLDNIQRWGVKMVLVSNIDGAGLPEMTRDLDEREANREAEDVVSQYSTVLRGLLWTRPADGSITRIEGFLLAQAEPGAVHTFVGLKFHPEMNQFAADDPVVDPYLALCEKYEMPAVFHSGAAGSNSDPEKIYAVAKRHPTVPIVLYHSGFEGNHDAAIEVAKKARAAGDADLYLETAQMDPDSVIKAILEVGSDRVMFGTDACYYGADHYSHYEKLIQRLLLDLSEEEFAQVVRENAKHVFNLD